MYPWVHCTLSWRSGMSCHIEMYSYITRMSHVWVTYCNVAIYRYTFIDVQYTVYSVQCILYVDVDHIPYMVQYIKCIYQFQNLPLYYILASNIYFRIYMILWYHTIYIYRYWYMACINTYIKENNVLWRLTHTLYLNDTILFNITLFLCIIYDSILYDISYYSIYIW